MQALKCGIHQYSSRLPVNNLLQQELGLPSSLSPIKAPEAASCIGPEYGVIEKVKDYNLEATIPSRPLNNRAWRWGSYSRAGPTSKQHIRKP